MADATFAPARPRRAASNLSRVPYLPGLDGMRALAVIAVLVYHANSEWLAGGFLGVEVFFVISGYLITLLLMAERERDGRIHLGAFWMRRARRLLPALFVMLFLVLTYTWMFERSSLGRLRGDFLGGFFYVSNWYQIWVGQSYGSTADFAPLRHLWSLAVEEQFYLVWPVVMLVLLRSGTRRLGLTARWLALGAVAVVVLTAVLHHGGNVGDCSVTPDAYWTIGDRCISKPNFLYLSTITRSSGLLLGAAMAMLWRPVAIMRGPLRRANRLLDLLGLVGVLTLAALVWFVGFHPGIGTDGLLFRGGLLLCALATMLLIAAVTHPRTVAARLLGSRPMLWVGTRSYGLYLYSWPLFEIIRDPSQPGLTLSQFVVAIVLTVVVTELSYRFVETPVRYREVARWWGSLRTRRDPVPRQVVAATVVASLLLLGVGVMQLGLAEIEQGEVAQALEEGRDDVTSIDELLGGSPNEGDAETPTATPPTAPPPDDLAADASTTTSTTTTTTTTTTLPAEPVDFLAIGDSVMLGAAGILSDRGYTVNAEVSRQMIDFVPVMEQLGDADLFGDPVIVHLGTNGPITSETLNAFLAPLSRVPNVIMLNVFANRPWTAENNRILAARDRPDGQDNIILVDWNSLAPLCPGDCFSDDGIHLNDAGRRYYASVIGDITGR